ncbi:hypothetical protein GCM10009743_56980 [Kribbella swartbergensis]
MWWEVVRPTRAPQWLPRRSAPRRAGYARSHPPTGLSPVRSLPAIAGVRGLPPDVRATTQPTTPALREIGLAQHTSAKTFELAPSDDEASIPGPRIQQKSGLTLVDRELATEALL